MPVSPSWLQGEGGGALPTMTAVYVTIASTCCTQPSPPQLALILFDCVFLAHNEPITGRSKTPVPEPNSRGNPVISRRAYTPGPDRLDSRCVVQSIIRVQAYDGK